MIIQNYRQIGEAKAVLAPVELEFSVQTENETTHSAAVRVQEASGSNPDTPTIGKHWKCMFPVLFLAFVYLSTSFYVR